MTQHSTPQASSAGPYFAPFHAYFGSLESVAQGMTPFKAVARTQLEMMGFFSRRTQAYLEIPSRLQQCRTPQDLFNEQARFWQTAFEQYAEAGRRMSEVWTQVSGTGMGQPVRATARDYITFGADTAPSAKPKANGHDRRAA